MAVPAKRDATPLAEPVERELKLRTSAPMLVAVREHPAVRAAAIGAPRRRRLISTYFDTRDGRLAACGASLRIRRVGHKRVQTLKLPERADRTIADRQEFEWRVRDDTPDTAKLGDTPLALPPGSLRRLRPVYMTDVTRTEIALRLDRGTECRLALDAGHVVAGAARTALSEIELELTAGGAAPVYALARTLHRDLPLLLSAESKAEIGQRLAGGATTIHKFAEPALRADAPVAAVFGQMAAAILRHWQANQAAALRGEAEGVHQVRAAIRRLKTVFNLFKAFIAPDDYAAMNDALTRLGRALGTARDWDVFVDETLRHKRIRQKPPLANAARRIARHAAPLRARAHNAAADTIQAPHYTRFLLETLARLEEQRWIPLDGGDHAAPIADCADALLRRQHRKAMKAGKHVARLSETERHTLRKRLKKLRYSAELLAGLYDERAAKRYLKRLKALLDRLGTLNDLTVAEPRLHDAADESKGQARKRDRQAADALERHWRKRHDKLLAGLPRAWRKLERTAAFWPARERALH
jgi:inorganic triphosphatase YgiF